MIMENLFWNTSRWPVMTNDSTDLSYWLNWRFLLCAIWIFVAMVLAALLIWRYEGRIRSESTSEDEPGCLYGNDVWGTCSKSIHPLWLLAYRLLAFCALLALLLADLIVNGAGILYYYTEWTFTLVTLYFGLGSLLSLRGYLHYCHKVGRERDNFVSDNVDHGSYVPLIVGEDASMPSQTESSNCYVEADCRIAASAWGYALQIVFQVSGGAVALTDSVYWLILYPSANRLTFLLVCMHSVNAVFLIGEAILNRLRFPFFRIAYFILLTCTYVIFQWIIHAFVSIRWPYSFLDLSSPSAPLCVIYRTPSRSQWIACISANNLSCPHLPTTALWLRGNIEHILECFQIFRYSIY